MLVGRGLAQAMGTLTKHGVKQVDRLLSNQGVDVWAFFAYWTPYIVGPAARWSSRWMDQLRRRRTGHRRAVDVDRPWARDAPAVETVASSTLKGNQRRYEYEVLCRLQEVMPAGVKVTVVADRGFADCKLFYALKTSWASSM